MQEALCQSIFLLLFAGRDGDKARPAPIMVGDATRAGDSWCTVPEVDFLNYLELSLSNLLVSST